MSHPAPLDKAPVLILVPLWAVAFALAMKTQLDGGGYAYIGLSVVDADRYPVLCERDGKRLETSRALFPVFIFPPWLAASFAFAASALLNPAAKAIDPMREPTPRAGRRPVR